jgi:SAM-dependent methyltransferase
VTFRAELLAVPPGARDAWVDRRFGLEGPGGLPDDGPSLPSGCVPYLPSPVDVVLRMVEEADVRDSDVFVDVGCGVGRTAALVQLLTGATVVGLEVQPELARVAEDLAVRLRLSRMTVVVGDAAAGVSHLADGSVYYLYCPFGGERLTSVLLDLERVAARRAIRVCCVDLPLPACAWLTVDAARGEGGDLVVYRSRSLAP